MAAAVTFVGMFVTVSYDLAQGIDIASLDHARLKYIAISGLLLLFAYPLMYLIERVFGFTSSVTLIELTNINNPILREMSKVAQGTFNHSMQVGNLAAEVADKIGAKPQLVRTGALYHDIGKMLKPCDFDDGDVLAMDRAYIDYEKLEDLTQHGVTYVTKMKRNLTYETISESVLLDDGRYRNRSVRDVVFHKGATTHRARIISYTETKTSRRGSKEQEVQLLTNSHDLGVDEVIAIYQRRWQIESLFKQLKQNFPLRYFYGVSENAIKTQIWVTLIANLLLTLVQRSLERRWSFSGLATMMRIILMLYIDMFDFFEHPTRDWERMLQQFIDVSVAHTAPCEILNNKVYHVVILCKNTDLEIRAEVYEIPVRPVMTGSAGYAVVVHKETVILC